MSAFDPLRTFSGGLNLPRMDILGTGQVWSLKVLLMQGSRSRH
jgi:hypothetical protein